MAWHEATPSARDAARLGPAIPLGLPIATLDEMPKADAPAVDTPPPMGQAGVGRRSAGAARTPRSSSVEDDLAAGRGDDLTPGWRSSGRSRAIRPGPGPPRSLTGPEPRP